MASMKLPLSLVQDFLPPLDIPPVKIGEVLTLLGIELDKIHNETPSFAKVVVGEVLEIKKHPDAKNLQVAQVSDGKETFTVVCGDPNCREGMKTAFAKLGAILTDQDGKQRQIEKTTIRGIESFGMLCSGSELHVSSESDQIMDLPSDLQTGEDVAKLLWDPVLELSLTPNLGHAMSALGVARELSAALQLPIERPEVFARTGAIDKKVIVHDYSLCPRYMCCLIENVKVGPSPFWLKAQLEACGQKSINNIVDVTNYICMKVGQPMHAFDYDKLHSKTLEIDVAETQDTFMCLDDTEVTIPKGALLIKDGSRPVAIAGVMGSKDSAVTEKTKTVLLEAACFEPISVRSTSRKMGLRTESSQRFEKGVDPVGVEQALFEAAELIEGKWIGYVDVNKGPFEHKEIPYRSTFINQILGTKLSCTEMIEIFKRLGFEATIERVRVPLFRTDIHKEIDLVEEVARIYGYNNIEKKDPKCTISEIPNNPMFVFENEIRETMIGMGLFEYLTCDLISPKLAEISREVTPESMHFLKARYAKSEEYSILRTSLLPGLLEVAKGNLSKKNSNLAGFEIGRIHFMQKKPVEIPNLAVLLTGKAEEAHWSAKARNFDFFDLKGIIENLVKGCHFVSSEHMTFHPKRQADIHVEEVIVGSLGEIHPTLLEKFDIEQRTYYAELNMMHLLNLKDKHLLVAPLPQFPASDRDWTITLPLKFPIHQILKKIKEEDFPLLEQADLIDLYTPVDGDVKNATFRFIYRDALKTISFDEVEREHDKIISTATKLLAK